MLLHEARRGTRTSPEGDLVLLEEQDRAQWNRDQIAEGTALVRRALGEEPVGAYTLQAAIAAVYANAPDFAATDWSQIVHLYDLLLQVTPSPVVEINRAAAVAMREDPAAGLELVDAILARGDLSNYPLAHSTRAELCRRLGRTEEARTAYQQALALSGQGPERRFLERRLTRLNDKAENEFPD
jgi:RNA polymerase sigma-70 factor (ECF subfamily)